ncbi:adhesion G protein-coupled receptor E3-like [Megalobrama amblycephala]|uniref:adhesion G protein-coupled receptor E3-like n=1 Tax=Megalobrama amblycephala TaxID=75352 RepID=UPI0020140B07|nr:adhesion G protein-coupled receptor E3-like [Megalobrama amblycephala]
MDSSFHKGFIRALSIISVMLNILTLSLAFTTVTPETTTNDSNITSTFLIYNKDHNKCVYAVNATKLQAEQCNAFSEAQHFRWISSSQIISLNFSLCLGAEEIKDWVKIILLPCNEFNPRQTWECKNETLFGLKGQSLHLNYGNNGEPNVMLYSGTGVWSHWLIYGTDNNLCSLRYQDSPDVWSQTNTTNSVTNSPDVWSQTNTTNSVTNSPDVWSQTNTTNSVTNSPDVWSQTNTTNSVTSINIMLQEGCFSQTSGGCFQNLLDQIENITAQVLPLDTVTNILTMVFNTSEKILESSSSSSSGNPAELVFYGNHALKTSEKLISTLVKATDTNDSVSFTLASVEVEVFMVGPNVTLDKIPRLDTTNSSVDIDLIGIAKNNNETRSAAVAFMSFNTMENLLKPDFFNTSDDTIKTMMSTVISATLPKTTNTKLTKPVNFTLIHIREFDPSGSLSCVYWNISEWIVDGCSVLETNSSYTVCSCVHLSTFALIMQTSRPPESNSLLDVLNLVCVIVGLVFFSLDLLTFALCQWSPGVNNVARINICISLLLAHLLFLLTQQFLRLIRHHQVLCAAISGVLHFLFLSGFVWMFIEAVLLFICVKNLSQISSKKREVLSSRYLCVIGYMVALVVVGVSVGLLPEGYGSEHCWIKMDKGFIWSFLGPVCVILALNIILFINIFINLNSTLKNLNAEVSQMKQTKIMVFKTLAQFVVLGCSWILGFFTNGRKELEILFLILNSQQGTFIFLVYCVLNNEIRQQYKKFFRCLCPGLKQH